MQLPLARPSACKQLYQRVNLLHDKVLTSRLHSAYLQQLKIVSLFRQDQSNPLRIVRRRRALCRAAAEEDSAAIAGTIRKDRNVLGSPLEICCLNPVTGAYADGYCRVQATDTGVHAVCAMVTDDFLEFTSSRGNILGSMSPVRAGQMWCIGAARWREAALAGKAPLVYLKSTSAEALATIPLHELQAHAMDSSVDSDLDVEVQEIKTSSLVDKNSAEMEKAEGS